MAVHSSIEGPDRRHLQQSHTRVNGDDGLGQTIIEPYHTPLLDLTPCPTPKKHTVLQLRLVENKENEVHTGKTGRGWSRRVQARQMLPGQSSSTPDDEDEPKPFRPVKSNPSAKSNPETKSAWGNGSATGRIRGYSFVNFGHAVSVFLRCRHPHMLTHSGPLVRRTHWSRLFLFQRKGQPLETNGAVLEAPSTKRPVAMTHGLSSISPQ